MAVVGWAGTKETLHPDALVPDVTLDKVVNVFHCVGLGTK